MTDHQKCRNDIENKKSCCFKRLSKVEKKSTSFIKALKSCQKRSETLHRVFDYIDVFQGYSVFYGYRDDLRYRTISFFIRNFSLDLLQLFDLNWKLASKSEEINEFRTVK